MRDDDLAATAGAAAGALWAAAVIAALFGAGGAPVGVLLLLGFVLIGVAAVAAPNAAQLSSAASSRAGGLGRVAKPARAPRTPGRPAHPRVIATLEPDDLDAAAELQPTDEFVSVGVEPPAPIEPQPLPALEPEPAPEPDPPTPPTRAVAPEHAPAPVRVAQSTPADDPVATFLAAARAWVAGDRTAAAEGFLTVSRLDHPLAERAATHLEELRAHGVELSADPAGAPAAHRV
jgi:hypothetical protein